MRHVTTLLAVAGLAAAASAQTLNNMRAITINATASGSQAVTLAIRGAGVGADMARIDDADFISWGYDSANPGMRKITGMIFIIQDFDVTTQEPVNMVAYGEDANNPDFPDPNNQLISDGPFGLPTTPPFPGSNGAMFEVRQAYTTPVLANGGEDTFIGVEYTTSAQVNPPNDGVFSLSVSDDNSFTEYDAYGHATIAQNSYAVELTGAGPATYPFQSSGATSIDPAFGPLLEAAAGTPAAVTNQSNYPYSNTAPGTMLGLSGLHPDATSTPRNAGRADDLSFIAEDVRVANGVWFFLIATGTNTITPLPLNQVGPPASTGEVCLDLVTAQVHGFGAADSNGIASFTLQPSAQVRALLGSQIADIWWQAIGIPPAGNAVHGTNCGAQHF